jgi:hypothetical protein
MVYTELCIYKSVLWNINKLYKKKLPGTYNITHLYDICISIFKIHVLVFDYLSNSKYQATFKKTMLLFIILISYCWKLLIWWQCNYTSLILINIILESILSWNYFDIDILSLQLYFTKLTIHLLLALDLHVLQIYDIIYNPLQYEHNKILIL